MPDREVVWRDQLHDAGIEHLQLRPWMIRGQR